MNQNKPVLTPKRSIQRTSFGMPGRRAGAALMVMSALCGCSSLLPRPEPAAATYALEAPPTAARPADTARAAPRAASTARAPTLLVSTPLAAPGYDNRRMAYTRSPHLLEYFARNEWIEPPARMLSPLIVTALQSDGAFFAVLPAPSVAASDMQLDSTLLRLQQNFNTRPSTVTFTLRASLVHTATRRVLAWREFEHSVPTQADTPQDGVVAANRAVQRVMAELALFCRAEALAWQAP